MTATIMLWVVPPAVLFLGSVLYVIALGFRTRNVDLRSAPTAPAGTGRWPVLLTHRGLNGPRT